MVHAEKKIWSWMSSFQAHGELMLRMPMYLAAPFILSTSEIDAIEEGMNDINDCNLSTVHHRGMKRIVDLSNDSGAVYLPLLKAYGTAFAESEGVGDTTSTLYDQIKTAKSVWAARAAESVAFFEMWENLVGNTMMDFFSFTLRGNQRFEQSFLFEVLFTIYYVPLYVLLVLYYTTIDLSSKYLSEVPKAAGSLIFKFLFMLASIIVIFYIIPYGIIGLISKIWLKEKDRTPIAAKTGYTQIADTPDTESISTLKTISFVKPEQSKKIGIRFGSDDDGNVIVSNIRQNSIAEMAGLKIGDVVYTVNGTDIGKVPPRRVAHTLSAAVGDIKMEVMKSSGVSEFDETTV